MVLSWKDKRVVTMLSNFSCNGRKEVRRYEKHNTIATIIKPDVILDHNKNMGGVDNSDHLGMT